MTERADDAGGRGEDGGGDQHRQVQRAVQPRQQLLDAVEQPLHDARLLEQEAHEQEERDRREHGVLHHRIGLQHGQVEHHRAERDEAGGQRHRAQREGDREADEDDGEQHAQGHQAQHLVAHTSVSVAATRSGHWPKRMACRHFRHSLKPWISSSSAGQRHRQLEGPGDRLPRAADEGLVGDPGLDEVAPADEQEHAGKGQQHQQVARQVDPRLAPRRPVGIEANRCAHGRGAAA